MSWRQLSRKDCENARVLFEGELITIRSLGEAMDSQRHKLTYLDGARMMRVTSVKGSHLTSVLGSSAKDQEE